MTEKRLVCMGGNTLMFQLNCIWNSRWEHESRFWQTWLVLPPPAEGCAWMGSRPRTEPVHATGTELCSESRTGKWSSTDIVSTQALFKLKEDYTPNASPMSEWVILYHSKTLGREMLNSKFSHPKNIEPYPGKVMLMPDGCQTSVRAPFLQLLKWMKDFTGASRSFL